MLFRGRPSGHPEHSKTVPNFPQSRLRHLEVETASPAAGAAWFAHDRASAVLQNAIRPE